MRNKSFPHYRQLGVSDCDPTSLRMIAKFYGLNYSQDMALIDKAISLKEVN